MIVNKCQTDAADLQQDISDGSLQRDTVCDKTVSRPTNMINRHVTKFTIDNWKLTKLKYVNKCRNSRKKLLGIHFYKLLPFDTSFSDAETSGVYVTFAEGDTKTPIFVM